MVKIKKIIIVIMVLLLNIQNAIYSMDLCVTLPKEQITLIEEIPFNKEVAITLALLRIREENENNFLEEALNEFNLDKVYMASFKDYKNIFWKKINIVVVAFPSIDGEHKTKSVEFKLYGKYLDVLKSDTFDGNAKVLIEDKY